MSNPLKRHLAKAALLLAAGAAPVAAAGQAGAAEQPQSLDLSGLTSLDNGELEKTLNNATTTATGLAEDIGGGAVKAAMPIVAPLAHHVVSETGQTTSSAAEDLTRVLTERTADPKTLDTLLPTLANRRMNDLSLL
ncbi:ATP-binding protein [Streptomyces sp. URMC 129]|uniref:ATP-binding protein n=1 Tax=Streptomyces sp. URMC 129 TaxID=3423407 RepID=UPI003F1C48DB